MKQLYQRTFEHINMPEEHSQALRSALASRCSNNDQEVDTMNSQKAIRRPAVLLIALLVVLALTTTAFAAGSYVVYHITSSSVDPAEGNVFDEWTDFEADVVLPYENYTEEDGEVIIDLKPGDWNQAK